LNDNHSPNVYFFKWLNEDDLHVYNEKLTVTLQNLRYIV